MTCEEIKPRDGRGGGLTSFLHEAEEVVQELLPPGVAIQLVQLHNERRKRLTALPAAPTPLPAPREPPSSPSQPMRGQGQLPQVPGECQEALWSSTASQGSERGAVGSQYLRGSGRACPQPPASRGATGVAGAIPLGAGGAPLQLGLHLPRPGLVTVPRGLPRAHGHVEPLAGGSQVAGGRAAPHRVPEFPGNLTRWELSAG